MTDRIPHQLLAYIAYKNFNCQPCCIAVMYPFVEAHFPGFDMYQARYANVAEGSRKTVRSAVVTHFMRNPNQIIENKKFPAQWCIGGEKAIALEKAAEDCAPGGRCYRTMQSYMLCEDDQLLMCLLKGSWGMRDPQGFALPTSKAEAVALKTNARKSTAESGSRSKRRKTISRSQNPTSQPLPPYGYAAVVPAYGQPVPSFPPIQQYLNPEYSLISSQPSYYDQGPMLQQNLMFDPNSVNQSAYANYPILNTPNEAVCSSSTYAQNPYQQPQPSTSVSSSSCTPTPQTQCSIPITPANLSFGCMQQQSPWSSQSTDWNCDVPQATSEQQISAQSSGSDPRYVSQNSTGYGDYPFPAAFSAFPHLAFPQPYGPYSLLNQVNYGCDMSPPSSQTIPPPPMSNLPGQLEEKASIPENQVSSGNADNHDSSAVSCQANSLPQSSVPSSPAACKEEKNSAECSGQATSRKPSPGCKQEQRSILGKSKFEIREQQRRRSEAHHRIFAKKESTATARMQTRIHQVQSPQKESTTSDGKQEVVGEKSQRDHIRELFEVLDDPPRPPRCYPPTKQKAANDIERKRRYADVFGEMSSDDSENENA